MARGTVARVEVFDAKVMSLFKSGGDVWSFTKNFGRVANSFARQYAPMRSGALKRAQHVNLIPGGIYGCRARLYNTSDHALYVHRGVVGPIRSTRPGGVLYLRAGAGRPGIRKVTVRGQRPQPFIDQGVESARRLLLR